MPTPSAPWINNGQITTIWAEGGTPPPSSCTNYYLSRRMADYFYKECPTGEIGSGVYYIVPAGKFWSMISQQDADDRAFDYLEEEGQKAANLNGVCVLGDFTEVFTSMQTAAHWDWVADRGFPVFPFYGKSFDNSVAYTLLPLLNFTFFSAKDGQAINKGRTIVPFSIEQTHGMIHIGLADTFPGEDSVLGAGWVTTGGMAQNLVPFQTYGGFLLGDFGSDQISGEKAWVLGGIIGIIETASSFSSVFAPHPTDPTADGHFTGYIVAYKDASVFVYQWSDEEEDYQVIKEIPFDMRNRTTYVGYGIRYDRGKWAAEIYINGAWQFSLFDDNIVSFTMMRYQKGVLSMDYWMGDLIIGSMSPFTNRVPPALSVQNFAPQEVYLDWPEPPLPERPEQYVEMVPQGEVNEELTGDEQVAEAISGPPKLRTLQPAKSLGFNVEVPGVGLFNRPFATYAARWDPREWTDPKIALQSRLFGCCPYYCYRWSKINVAHFPNGMNRVYEGGMTTDDEMEYFNIPDTDFPDAIAEMTVSTVDYHSDFAYLSQTPAACKTSGLDRAVLPEDMLEPYLWESMTHQTFPFTGQMYTKEYIASRWIYFTMFPQFPDGVSEPTEFNYHLTQLRMFSGARGIRTRRELPAPDVYEIPDCRYPTCQLPGHTPIFETMLATFSGGDESLDAGTSQLCDTLWPGILSIPKGGWNWSVLVSDYLDGEQRVVQVTLNMISVELMDDFMWSSTQLMPLVTGLENLRLLAWRTDWPLPVWDSTVTLTGYELNVPPLPPSGGPGMPPTASLIYTVAAPTGEQPAFADTEGNFYFHLMRG